MLLPRAGKQPVHSDFPEARNGLFPALLRRPSSVGVFNYPHLKTSMSNNHIFSHLGNNFVEILS